MLKMFRSTCCNAPVVMKSSIPDFIGDKEGISICYICSKCGKPCGARWIEVTIEEMNDE